MSITNRHGLPSVLVNLMTRDDYSRGDARISVTGLIDEPQIHQLKEHHKADIEEDVADGVWSLFGRAVHGVLEGGAGPEHIVEERITTTILGWKLSGAMDLQTMEEGGRAIEDYKVTSAYNVMNQKKSWEQQLNVYKWLVEREKGVRVTRLAIVAIVRDFNRNMVGTKEGYPVCPVVTIPIRMWSNDEAEAFVVERITAHQEAARAMEWGDELPVCSEEGMWLRGGTWAVMVEGRKRAFRVFDNQKEAELCAMETPKATVEHRPGEPIRCTGFCPVSKWCVQFAQYKEDHNG